MSLTNLFSKLKGGSGSGNLGHAGIIGKRGGSAPKGTISISPEQAGTLQAWENALGVTLPEDDGKHYYHSTTADKLEGIKSQGLVPSSSDNFEGYSTGRKVSLSPTLNDATYWSSSLMWRDFDRNKGIVRKPLILRTPKFDEYETYRSDEYRTDKVSKENLEILTSEGWKKL